MSSSSLEAEWWWLSVTPFKLVTALAIFLCGFASTMIPLWVVHSNELLFSAGNMMACGVLLAGGLVHQLPDSTELFDALLFPQQQEQEQDYDDDDEHEHDNATRRTTKSMIQKFPWSYFICGVVFLLFLILEESVHMWLEERSNNPNNDEDDDDDDDDDSSTKTGRRGRHHSSRCPHHGEDGRNNSTTTSMNPNKATTATATTATITTTPKIPQRNPIRMMKPTSSGKSNYQDSSSSCRGNVTSSSNIILTETNFCCAGVVHHPMANLHHTHIHQNQHHHQHQHPRQQSNHEQDSLLVFSTTQQQPPPSEEAMPFPSSWTKSTTSSSSSFRGGGGGDFVARKTVSGTHHHHEDHIVEHLHGSLLASIFLLLALSVHSILAGITLGLVPDTESIVSTAVAILAHKGFAGYAFGSTMVAADLEWNTHHLPLAICFSLSTPIGIGLGMLIAAVGASSTDNDDDSSSSSSSSFSLLSIAIAKAVVAGTFAYVAIFELGVKELLICREDKSLLSQKQGESLKLISVMIGFLGMSSLVLFV